MGDALQGSHAHVFANDTKCRAARVRFGTCFERMGACLHVVGWTTMLDADIMLRHVQLVRKYCRTLELEQVRKMKTDVEDHSMIQSELACLDGFQMPPVEKDACPGMLGLYPDANQVALE
jgi:hypothetical protein